MRETFLFVLFVVAGGLGGLLGSIAGSYFGSSGLFTGGVLGGLVAAPSAAWLAARVGWLDRRELPDTAAGAALGFAAAATVALLTIQSPVGPLLSPLLVGLGGFAGRTIARRRTLRHD
jgi:hypothetical protein